MQAIAKWGDDLPQKKYLYTKMYWSDHALSICKLQASISPWYHCFFPPWASKKKCRAEPDPKLSPRWCGRNTELPPKRWFESQLTWELQGRRRSCQKQRSKGHGTSQQSPFCLGITDFPLSDQHNFSFLYFPSIWVSHRCRFPVLASCREKTLFQISCTLPGQAAIARLAMLLVSGID